MATEAIEQQRRETYEIAEAIATTWERRRADIEGVMTPVREWMLRELSAQAGDTVLELAAGVGDTGFDAVAFIGEQGRLISTDISPAMLAAARRRGAERGLRNVEYRDADEYLSLISDTAGPLGLAHTRYLPTAIRNNVLRFLGRRIFRANYRPLLDQP